MSSKNYVVTHHDPIQVTPCVGSGLRAVFRDVDGSLYTSPVAAMAVCRVRVATFRDGVRIDDWRVSREVCGVITWTEDGFGICESLSNFCGYLQPGQELDASTNQDVSTAEESRK